MRISRFRVAETLFTGQILELPAATAHYIVNVLRLAPGTTLHIFDGQGYEFEAMLESAGKRQAVVCLGKPVEPAPESPLAVHLALGLTRGERMDYAIQKATELGAASFTPILSERCEVRLKGERIDKRLEHWQQVAVSACEQSGRATVPSIHAPVPLDTFIRTASASLRLILDHRQAQALPATEQPIDAIVLTGPEGGFTECEISAAIDQGYQAVCLGGRVLRAETAPVAALSVLQWVWGDFRKG